MLIKILLKLSTMYWGIFYKGFRKKYQLSHDFRFNGKNILLYGNGMIKIGSNSYIGENSTIQAVDSATVTIGQYCQISHNVRIYSQTSIANHDFRIRPIPSKTSNVSIGDHCWIGANVFINPGVNIGANSIIGANSVVTKNVPENEIWGGVPAKLIRMKTDIRI